MRLDDIVMLKILYLFVVFQKMDCKDDDAYTSIWKIICFVIIFQQNIIFHMEIMLLSLTPSLNTINLLKILTLQLLDVLNTCNVKNFIFSSSAAVYGIPKDGVCKDDDESLIPINPYGKSKLMRSTNIERLLQSI